ncbi:MAG: cobyric acid synthase [Dehalococcoidales bacterium]|nr:cobyric acid synthase [Dehalococcoidales bacterium]
MTAKTLMIQGTASSVGKSILVTALCRIFRQDGYRVAPFKSQNMALNSFVTKEGGEIGRAQAVQAEAAGIEPSVHMNPVLLKPESNARSQVIVLGKVECTLRADCYYEYTPRLLSIIGESLERLRSGNDIVIIEGAGSPAEVNLKEREIANMRIALMAGAPVLLVGDIDRGGVFASLVGTMELLTEEERNTVKGFVINKFRGDVSLLRPGLDFLEKKTARPVLGVVPYFRDIGIAQEDSVYLDERPRTSTGLGLKIAVVRLPHISNYDDFDPLEEMGCRLSYIGKASKLIDPDLIILPGTKSTMADLEFLKQEGMDRAIIRLSRAGVPVAGICGGYQMLGTFLKDPSGVESPVTSAEGLGLLAGETIFQSNKTTTQVKARVKGAAGVFKGLEGLEVEGYEIHNGLTTVPRIKPAFEVLETPDGPAGYFDGSISDDGLVFGSYIHGLWHNTSFTGAFLERLREIRGLEAVVTRAGDKDARYDRLADLVRMNLDMSRLYKIIEDAR